MTDTQKLRDLGLTDAEIEDMQEEGALTAMEMDVSAARDLALKYYALDMDEKGNELLDAADSNAAYWIGAVHDLTGVNLEYDLTNDHWRNVDTGQYALNPYIDIRVDQYELDQWLINRYS